MVAENFMTYTEVDIPGGDVSCTAARATWSSMRRDAEAYFWKDYNAGFFGDFEHQFTFNLSDTEAGDISSVAYMFADVI